MYWIRNMRFPIGGRFEPTVHLARFLRYQASKVLWSRLWPFGSRDVIGHATNGFPRCHFLLLVNTNRPCNSHGFWDIELQKYWGHGLDLLGSRDVTCHVTSPVTWPLDSQCGVSYRWYIWTDRLSRTVFEILSFKNIGVTALTFWGHVTSSVTWPRDSQYGVSYRWSIWTVRRSRTVFEILNFKGILVVTEVSSKY